jgi:hypothetical protein
VDEHTISVAGDPFHAKGEEREKGQCFCWDGFVFIGHMVFDEDEGEEVEVFERFVCRHCGGRSR